MIDKFKQSTTLKVCLDDAGTHNRAILDFFFAKLGQHIFRCVDTQQEANVLLIDYDFPPARQRYEAEYQQWDKPALVLSISEVSLDNAIWLAKPLTSRALLDAAATLQQQLASRTAEPPVDNASTQAPSGASVTTPLASVTLQRPPTLDVPPPVNLPLVSKPVEPRPVDEAIDNPSDAINSTDLDYEAKKELADDAEIAARQPAEGVDDNAAIEESVELAASHPRQLSEAESIERMRRLCGEGEDIKSSADLANFHEDDSFFLSSLKDAVRLARQCQQGVLLNFPQARIYVLPEIHRVFCGIDIYEDEFTNLIANCNVRDGGKMHILSTKEIHELNDMISQQTSSLYDLESFVWTSTLLSAKGRLPRTLDPKKPVGLKHWPSLTRLENFPHVMSIAAQWSVKAMSAFEIAQSLSIPQRYVFSFYNAANSLGLIEQDPDKLINKQPVTRTKDAPKGLFSRLLKRLVGG